MDTTALIERYFEIWNENDADRRRELIAQTWAADCRYIDPVTDVATPDGIQAMVGGFQQQFPGLTFTQTGEIEIHHDRIRFSWDCSSPDGDRVIAGTDVAVLSPDGRLHDVTGFFDEAPVLPDAVPEGVTT